MDYDKIKMKDINLIRIQNLERFTAVTSKRIFPNARTNNPQRGKRQRFQIRGEKKKERKKERKRVSTITIISQSYFSW